MRLTSRKNSSRSITHRHLHDVNPLLSSLSGLPLHCRRASVGALRDMEAFVTLFKRDSVNEPRSRNAASPPNDENIAMSNAGQKVIPAVFKLVPTRGKDAVTSEEAEASPQGGFDQAGGHGGTFRSRGGVLVKKVTHREASFYEQAQKGEWPKGLLPKFYGRTAEGDAIKIEDLTYRLKKPCVMDLKMGVQTVEDDESSLLKKLKMTALDKVTGTKSAGCRLEGLSMYRSLEKGHIKGTKAQSHSISANVRVSLQDVLTFFLTDESGVRTDLALRFQGAIENILDQFKKNNKFRFIGSSILLIYDNDNDATYMRWARALRKLHTINPKARLSDDQISGLTRRTKCDVRMIDFAHTGPLPAGLTLDHGYITGLQTILKALKAIRMYRAKPIFSVASAVVDVMEEKRALAQSGSVDIAHASGTGDFTFDTLLGELTPLSQGHPGRATSSKSMP